jgi:hypothetical protein
MYYGTVQNTSSRSREKLPEYLTPVKQYLLASARESGYTQKIVLGGVHA